MFLILTLGIVAFLISLVVTPLVRDALVRFDVVDRPDQQRKLHPRPIPRVGGIVIAISYTAAFVVVLFLPFSNIAAVREILPRFWTVLPAAELIFVTGLLDDVISLRPWQKLIGQILAAVLAYYGGVRVAAVGQYSLEPWAAFIITILWLIACTNAFNLIDGMDGLATGVGMFATMTVLISALTHNSMDLAMATVPLIGCLLGFLRYNFNPASAFLGDSGSLLIGFLLGCFGAMWVQKSATLLGMTAPLMAVSIPLMDASLAVVRRFIRNKSIFAADRGHIHHRLLDRGLTTRRSALLIYGISGLAATFSLLQDVFENQVGGLIVVLFCAAAWIGIQHLGYVEFGVARQMFTKGTFRRMIDMQTRLQILEKRLNETRNIEEIWKQVTDAMGEFGFESAELQTAGRHFSTGSENGHAGWQLDTAIGDGYLKLSRTLNSADAVPVGTFVAVVRMAIERKLAEEQVVPVREAAAMRASASSSV